MFKIKTKNLFLPGRFIYEVGAIKEAMSQAVMPDRAEARSLSSIEVVDSKKKPMSDYLEKAGEKLDQVRKSRGIGKTKELETAETTTLASKTAADALVQELTGKAGVIPDGQIATVNAKIALGGLEGVTVKKGDKYEDLMVKAKAHQTKQNAALEKAKKEHQEAKDADTAKSDIMTGLTELGIQVIQDKQRVDFEDAKETAANNYVMDAIAKYNTHYGKGGDGEVEDFKPLTEDDAPRVKAYLLGHLKNLQPDLKKVENTDPDQRLGYFKRQLEITALVENFKKFATRTPKETATWYKKTNPELKEKIPAINTYLAEHPDIASYVQGLMHVNTTVDEGNFYKRYRLYVFTIVSDLSEKKADLRAFKNAIQPFTRWNDNADIEGTEDINTKDRSVFAWSHIRNSEAINLFGSSDKRTKAYIKYLRAKMGEVEKQADKNPKPADLVAAFDKIPGPLDWITGDEVVKSGTGDDAEIVKDTGFRKITRRPKNLIPAFTNDYKHNQALVQTALVLAKEKDQKPGTYFRFTVNGEVHYALCGAGRGQISVWRKRPAPKPKKDPKAPAAAPASEPKAAKAPGA